MDSAKTANPPPSVTEVAARSVMAKMEVREPAFRSRSGSIHVLIPFPGRIFLYGPFIRLAQGRYRLGFRCRVRLASQRQHPVIGLEVIGQNRTLLVWRDYTADELASGEQKLTFDVPEALAIGNGADVPFEFRFSHFGSAILDMTDVTLAELGPGDDQEPSLEEGDRWRLLGRLKTLPLPGPVTLSRLTVPRLKLGRLSACLRLPAGPYRLDVACQPTEAQDAQTEILEVVIQPRDHPSIGGARFRADQLSTGSASFAFAVPVDIGLDVGTPRDIEIDVRTFGNAKITLTALDLTRLPQGAHAPVAAAPALASAPARLGAKKIVIFGNCQAGLIAEALNSHSAFARHFSLTHHFLNLAPNLHEQARRELESSQMLLVQDIKEWESYPLRDYVPSHLPILRFPCVRFASLWPFDAFNGPDDAQARDHDGANFEFTYFDGLLGRLRHEIPDPEARFAAYRSLEIPGVINVKRLHAFEEKRLQGMDRAYPGEIGAYILENFRKKQVFYTTAHPNGKILKRLMQQIARELGVRQSFWFSGELDSLKRLQIPVHPKVADALQVKWAQGDRRYLVRGEWVSWEDYVRKYIAYYG